MRGLAWVCLWIAVFAVLTVPFGDDGADPIWMSIAGVVAFGVTGWAYEAQAKKDANRKASERNDRRLD